MRIRPIALLMVMMVWCLSGCLLADAAENTLYLLGVSLDQEDGVAGGWTGVGEKGAWKETVAGTILKDRLYTVETRGVLYETDLTTGKWKPIGKPEFGKAAFLFAANNALYIIATDGNLVRVNPSDGSWVVVGAPGDWKNTLAGTILNNRLYTTESNGALYATDLTTGNWKQIGNLDFGDTTAMLSANGALYTLRTDGSLYAVNLGDGSRVQIGVAQGWKNAIGRVGFHNQLITAESNGGLVVSNLSNGTREAIGQHEFGDTKFMFAAGDSLYTIEKDGSLYRVYLKPGGGIGAYDWCPQEPEIQRLKHWTESSNPVSISYILSDTRASRHSTN